MNTKHNLCHVALLVAVLWSACISVPAVAATSSGIDTVSGAQSFSIRGSQVGTWDTNALTVNGNVTMTGTLILPNFNSAPVVGAGCATQGTIVYVPGQGALLCTNAGTAWGNLFTSAGGGGISSQIPVANNMHITITDAVDNQGTVYGLLANITGGTATGIAISSPPTQNANSASVGDGMTLNYTYNSGCSTDTFQYTASNNAGTSAPATVTVTQSCKSTGGKGGGISYQ